jgi:nitrogen-specific signal transduction histidine kinase/ActR/RegA family two-component response regulator
VIGGKRYTFGSFQNITARKQSEAALHEAKEAAEAANKAKSDFLSNMSHELRTPMNAILGFTQLMEGDASCTTDQQENLQQISKAGWHLLDLINEVLDLARVESGDVKLSIGAVAPGEMVAECLALVSPLLAQRKISIENRLAIDMPEVRADYMRLKQVLINFLSNGIKYNREAGTLVIEAKQEGNTLHLSVRDAGCGMTEDQLLHLFEPFTRFGDTDSVQGTGIGLSICKKLIERMNGKIQVESVVGEGSVFTLVLPLSETVAEHEPKSAARGELSLLYIEDDAAQQSLLGKWARDHGWNIVFAHDASSGIDAAMKSRYDAILLDIDLPGGFNGLDVKSVFDEMESLRVVPVIGISNMVAKADIEAALQAGFAAYLTKPVDLAELDRVTQTVISGLKIED